MPEALQPSRVTTRQVAVATSDGEFAAMLWEPQTAAPVPGVLLIQEIFGVNANIRGTAQWLAGHGFCVLAPDLFWRSEREVQLDPTVPEQRDKAQALLKQFDIGLGLADCAAAIQKLRQEPRCNGSVAAIGYCLGGRVAFLLARGDSTRAAVAFYPVAVAGDIAVSPAPPVTPLLVHLGEQDALCPPPAQAALQAHLKSAPDATVHIYPEVGHAFARLGRSGAAARAAELAEQRTIEFLKSHL
jgi:carboxymethylenebutenolidase